MGEDKKPFSLLSYTSISDVVSGVGADNIPILYIAGKVSGRTKEEREKNRHVGAQLALTLRKIGVGFYSPHLHTEKFLDESDMTEESYTENQKFWYPMGVNIMLACDGVVMLPGWHDSVGASLEYEVANAVGMPVLDLSNSLTVYAGGEINLVNDDLYGITTFAKGLNNYPSQFLAMRLLAAKNYFLHVSKNKDYSPYNIKSTGIIGLATRIWDKVARFMNLCGCDIGTGKWGEPKSAKNESVDDTLDDLANYAMIARVYRMGMWGV